MKNVCVIFDDYANRILETARLVGQINTLLICGTDPMRLSDIEKRLRCEGIEVETMICNITNLENVNRLAHYANCIGHIVAVIHFNNYAIYCPNFRDALNQVGLGTINILNAFFSNTETDRIFIDISESIMLQRTFFIVPKRIYRYALVNYSHFVRILERWTSLFPEKLRFKVESEIVIDFRNWLVNNKKVKRIIVAQDCHI